MSPQRPTPLILDGFDHRRALAERDHRHLRVEFDPATRRRITSAAAPPERRTVLLLGGTGFVGIHLLDTLLADPRIERVYAIVRADDETAGRRRLEETAGAYRLSLPQRNALTVLPGDVLSERYGLSSADHTQLVESVDAVMHVAVGGDYFQPYEGFFSRWTQELLDTLSFCTTGRIKHLTYMGSTIAHVYQEPRDFTRSDSFWHCGYSRMKWVNHALLQGLFDSGMPLTLCHSPYLFGSTAGGRDPGMRYAFWHAQRAALQVGATYRGEAASFAPVDIACEALVTNLFEDEPLRDIRPLSPRPYGNELLGHLMGIDVVEWEEFRARVADLSDQNVRRIYTVDLPRLIALTNLPPCYPPSFDLARFPTPEQLMPGYLRDVGLLSEPRRAAGG